MKKKNRRRWWVLPAALLVWVLAVLMLVVLWWPGAAAQLRTQARVQPMTGWLVAGDGVSYTETLTLQGDCRGFILRASTDPVLLEGLSAVPLAAPPVAADDEQAAADPAPVLTLTLYEGETALAAATVPLDAADAAGAAVRLVFPYGVVCAGGRTLTMAVSVQGGRAALAGYTGDESMNGPAAAVLRRVQNGISRPQAGELYFAQVTAVAGDGNGLAAWCVLLAVLGGVCVLLAAAPCTVRRRRSVGRFVAAALFGGALAWAVTPAAALTGEAALTAASLPAEAAAADVFHWRWWGEALLGAAAAPLAGVTLTVPAVGAGVWTGWPALAGAALGRLVGGGAQLQLALAAAAALAVYTAFAALAVGRMPADGRTAAAVGLLGAALGVAVRPTGWLAGAALAFLACVLSAAQRAGRTAKGDWLCIALCGGLLLAAAFCGQPLWALPLAALALLPLRRFCPVSLLVAPQLPAVLDAPAHQARLRVKRLWLFCAGLLRGCVIVGALVWAIGGVCPRLNAVLSAPAPQLTALGVAVIHWLRGLPALPAGGYAGYVTAPLWTLVLAAAALLRPEAIPPTGAARRRAWGLLLFGALVWLLGAAQGMPLSGAAVLALGLPALWTAAPRALRTRAVGDSGICAGALAALVCTALVRAALLLAATI